jgi:hypothetical protein
VLVLGLLVEERVEAEPLSRPQVGVVLAWEFWNSLLTNPSVSWIT